MGSKMRKATSSSKSSSMSLSILTRTRALFAASLVLGLMSSQSALAEARTINDGVFTQAQVNAGKATYDTACKTCHDMRFYRDALKSWDGQPVLWMWETILGTMPADNPGSLMLEEYTDVVAYILSENGFPTGESALDPDGNMADITIVAP